MSLAPQQIRPAVVCAQLCCPPSARSEAVPERPVTFCAPCGVVVPSPSWPAPFAPQQATSPVVRIAQAWCEPTATAIAGARPGTGTGVADHPAPAGPVPSWPASFEPQHSTAPSTIAQLVSPPAAMLLAAQHACPQEKNPGLQMSAHCRATQVAVASCGAVQTFSQLPQWFGSVSVEM